MTNSQKIVKTVGSKTVGCLVLYTELVLYLVIIESMIYMHGLPETVWSGE